MYFISDPEPPPSTPLRSCLDLGFTTPCSELLGCVRLRDDAEEAAAKVDRHAEWEDEEGHVRAEEHAELDGRDVGSEQGLQDGNEGRGGGRAVRDEEGCVRVSRDGARRDVAARRVDRDNNVRYTRRSSGGVSAQVIVPERRGEELDRSARVRLLGHYIGCVAPPSRRPLMNHTAQTQTSPGRTSPPLPARLLQTHSSKAYKLQ